MYSLLVFPLIFFFAVAERLPANVETVYSCQATIYENVFFNSFAIIADPKNAWVTKSINDCIEKCLSTYDCKAVNYAANTNLCEPLLAGISDPNNVDPTSYSPTDGIIHIYLHCDIPQFRPSTATVGCGQQSPNYKAVLTKNTRILGGFTANPNSWPWLVELEMVGYSYRSFTTWHTCGSSLLRIRDGVEESDILLTAAHCVVRNEGGIMGSHDAERFQAIAGNHLRDTYDIGEQVRYGVEIRYHPNYIPYINDIALIKLDKPIRFTDTIRPICLADRGEQLPTDKTCVAAGWGKSGANYVIPNALQQLTVPVHSADTCNDPAIWGATYIQDTMVCAGTLNGTSNICQGDSGGPLVCQQSDGGWKLYGVTSFVKDTTCTVVGKPGVFARVSSYIDWINQNMLAMTSF